MEILTEKNETKVEREQLRVTNQSAMNIDITLSKIPIVYGDMDHAGRHRECYKGTYSCTPTLIG